MIIPFGKYKGKEISSIEDDEYLIWIVKKYRGDYFSKIVGGDKFKISDGIVLEVRKVLKNRGYKFSGSRIEL